MSAPDETTNFNATTPSTKKKKKSVELKMKCKSFKEYIFFNGVKGFIAKCYQHFRLLRRPEGSLKRNEENHQKKKNEEKGSKRG